MSLPAAWLVHTIAVEPYIGRAGDGTEQYGAAVSVACLVELRTRRVRAVRDDSTTGDEVVSTATAYCDLEQLSSFPPESRITLPATLGGRTTYVLEAAPRDGGSLPVPSHLEVICA